MVNDSDKIWATFEIFGNLANSIYIDRHFITISYVYPIQFHSSFET